MRINGIEAMSANGGTDARGGTNRGRNFDFNTFASELFNNITVRKTAAAEIEEGSLGATVDLRTGRPFDYNGFTIAGSLQAGYNDLTQDSDPRAALLVSNTFADGKFGALFSLAYTERKLPTMVRAPCVGRPAAFRPGLDPAYVGTPTLTQINAAFHPRIPRYDHYAHDQQRLGESRPHCNSRRAMRPRSASMRCTPSSMRSATRSSSKRPVFSTGGATGLTGTNVVDAVIDGDTTRWCTACSTTWTFAPRLAMTSCPRSSRRSPGRQTHLQRYLQVQRLVGFAEANHDNPVQTTLLFDARNIDGYSYDYRQNSRLPLITYGTTASPDPATWTLTQIRLRPQSTTQQLRDGVARLRVGAPETFTLKFGPQWKNYNFKSTESRRSNGEGTLPASALRSQSRSPATAQLTHFGTGLSLPAGSVTTWLGAGLNAAVDALDLNNRSLYPMGIEPVLGNNNEVEEDDMGAYVQGDFKFELGAHTLRGNVGVRYVKTDLTSRRATRIVARRAGLARKPRTITRTCCRRLNLVYDLSDIVAAALRRRQGA